MQPLAGLMRSARQRVRRWAFERIPQPQSSVTLQRKRIYIVPTRAGAGFGLICLILLLGAMNYSNSLAFGLCFLLAGLGLVAMQQTHRNLLGINLHGAASEPVFAGQTAHFNLVLANPGQVDRFALGLRFLDGPTVVWKDLPRATRMQISLPCSTRTRGWLPAPRLVITSRFPFGLFHAWSYASLDARVLVYPQPLPEQRRPPPARGRQHHGRMSTQGQEDYAGLRSFHPGDSPRHIHWRAYPRHDSLLVKQFADPFAEELWLDWQQLAPLPGEQRLRQLCTWVLAAQRRGQSYGLRLPGQQLAPGSGLQHRHRALSMLALYRP